MYPGDLPPGVGLHPGGLRLGGVCICGELGRPPLDNTGYSQQTGGTYPTGMHSCVLLFLASIINQSHPKM